MSDTLKACLCLYDIPTASRLANPSPRLRRIGVRANLSVWIIPEHLVPYSLLRTMAAAGATWHVVRFDTSESEKIIQIARDAINRDMRGALARARKAAHDAAEAYENPEEGSTPTIADFEDRVQRAVRRAEQVLADLTQAAGVFQIDRTLTPVEWALQQASTIRSAAHDRAKAYAEAAAQARKIGTSDSTGIAAAAEADAVPAGVLADVIDEAGGDASELRKAFHEQIVGV